MNQIAMDFAALSRKRDPHTSEEWRPVPGYEGAYEVSDRGLVRSLGRNVATPNCGIRFVPGRVLKAVSDGTGYLRVSLSFAPKGRVKSVRVHVLVAMAFLCARPSASHVVGHYDGDRANNGLLNLRWVTQKENEEDKKRHGRNLFGARANGAKLTDEQVRLIRLSALPSTNIARELGLSKSTICRARRGDTWAHL